MTRRVRERLDLGAADKRIVELARRKFPELEVAPPAPTPDPPPPPPPSRGRK